MSNLSSLCNRGITEQYGTDNETEYPTQNMANPDERDDAHSETSLEWS